MYSITRHGETCHGTSVSGLGVFTDENGDTYAGQHKDGCACGLGVDSWATGKIYAEYGPDGEWDGRWLDRNADGDTVYYLFQRGEEKDSAFVYADGRCMYNGEACTPDDPRLLALTAQVAPVEVRLAAPTHHPPLASPLAPKRSSDGSAGSFRPSAGAGDRRGRRGAPPFRTPSLVAMRRGPTAAALPSTPTQ